MLPSPTTLFWAVLALLVLTGAFGLASARLGLDPARTRKRLTLAATFLLVSLANLAVPLLIRVMGGSEPEIDALFYVISWGMLILGVFHLVTTALARPPK